MRYVSDLVFLTKIPRHWWLKQNKENISEADIIEELGKQWIKQKRKKLKS